MKLGSPKPTTTAPEAKTLAAGENVVQTAHGLKDEPIGHGLRASASPAGIKNYGSLEAQEPAQDLLAAVAGATAKEFNGKNLDEIKALLEGTGVNVSQEPNGKVELSFNNKVHPLFKEDTVEVDHGSVLVVKPPFLGTERVLVAALGPQAEALKVSLALANNTSTIAAMQGREQEHRSLVEELHGEKVALQVSNKELLEVLRDVMATHPATMIMQGLRDRAFDAIAKAEGR